MNKIILFALPVMILGLIAPHAMAHGTNGDRYNQGFADGQQAAADDWNSHTFQVSSGGNSQCPDGHSSAYCLGYVNGYNSEWQRSIQVNYNTNLQQSQTSGVNIKGNNNRVQVNQGQGVSGDGSGSDGGGSGNPQCRVLCSVIH